MKRAQHDIKHGLHTGHPCLKVSALAMVETLGITDDGDYRKDSFHAHALIQELFWHSLRYGGMLLGQRKPKSPNTIHAIVALNEWMKLLIMRIGGKQYKLHLP